MKRITIFKDRVVSGIEKTPAMRNTSSSVPWLTQSALDCEVGGQQQQSALSVLDNIGVEKHRYMINVCSCRPLMLDKPEYTSDKIEIYMSLGFKHGVSFNISCVR